MSVPESWWITHEKLFYVFLNGDLHFYDVNTKSHFSYRTIQLFEVGSCAKCFVDNNREVVQNGLSTKNDIRKDQLINKTKVNRQINYSNYPTEVTESSMKNISDKSKQRSFQCVWVTIVYLGHPYTSKTMNTIIWKYWTYRNKTKRCNKLSFCVNQNNFEHNNCMYCIWNVMTEFQTFHLKHKIAIFEYVRSKLFLWEAR